ncbi:unnamed protein product [Ectocarpus sp. 8 AP-2014]
MVLDRCALRALTLHGCEHGRDPREIMEEFIDQARGLLPHERLSGESCTQLLKREL